MKPRDQTDEIGATPAVMIPAKKVAEIQRSTNFGMLIQRILLSGGDSCIPPGIFPVKEPQYGT